MKWSTQMSMTETQDTRKLQEHLRLERLEYRWEMQRALMCISVKEKKALVADWKSRYSEQKTDYLIYLARNKKAMYAIANWNVDNFRNTSK